jgi:hypothetical protein
MRWSLTKKITSPETTIHWRTGVSPIPVNGIMGIDFAYAQDLKIRTFAHSLKTV